MSHYKKVPHYWWDFECGSNNDVDAIVVESDIPEHHVIKRLPFSQDAIGLAQQLIKDLEAGRADPRRQS